MSEAKQKTKKSKSNFYYAFSVLPKEKREAIYTLYSFCRETDDIADSDIDPRQKKTTLDRWEEELYRQFNQQSSTRFLTLWKMAEKFRIPVDYFLELIKGVRMDLANECFHTIDDLIRYCYRVASVVGLMSIQIFGYRDERVKEYAVNLGIALQLTNIIRDVGVDADMGRVYLPMEDLKKFGLTPEDILNKRKTEAFTRLMQYESQRAREFYLKADHSLPGRERRNMIPSQIMRNIYHHLLQVLEKKQFDVLHGKTEIPNFVKVSIAFRTFFTELLMSG
ncbi:MAG: presqualene diphosphate synthase HpnD [Calditrichia bacterium]